MTPDPSVTDAGLARALSAMDRNSRIGKFTIAVGLGAILAAVGICGYSAEANFALQDAVTALGLKPEIAKRFNSDEKRITDLEKLGHDQDDLIDRLISFVQHDLNLRAELQREASKDPTLRRELDESIHRSGSKRSSLGR